MGASVDYYVLTQLLIDDIHLPSGEQHKNQLGGGIYAAAGMRIWSEHVGFCCAPGPDFEGNYDHWFLNNQVEISGGRRTKKLYSRHNQLFSRRRAGRNTVARLCDAP